MGASSNSGNMLSMAAASLFLPFLPMLATQILLNNLLYDVSEIGIPFDNVRATDIAQPQRWRMQDIMRFAGVMGPLSSVFDLVTFGVLFLWNRLVRRIHRHANSGHLHCPHARASAAGPAQSHPDDHDADGSGLALAIPFSPLGKWSGFRNLPPHLAIALGGIVAVYLVCAELFKPLAITGGLLERGPQVNRA